jgi:hypothetical protein
MKDKLPEAPDKWLCRDCGETCTTLLSAENPFEIGDTISGCPHCRSVESLEGACQIGDCKRPASGGHPGGHGFRYIWTCWKHRPQ